MPHPDLHRLPTPVFCPRSGSVRQRWDRTEQSIQTEMARDPVTQTPLRSELFFKSDDGRGTKAWR